MTTLISVFLVATLALLVASAAAGLIAAVMQVGRRAPATEPTIGTTQVEPSTPSRAAMAGVLAAAITLAVALVLRTMLIGHAPWSNLHEFSLAFAMGLLATYLLLARAYPIAGLAPLVALLAALLVGFGLSLDDSVDPLVPALQQPLLLTIHVGAAAAAYAVAGVAFLAAAAEIVQRRLGDQVRALPDAATLRAVGHRAVLIGFPILTAAIALGSVWANLAWRSYWSNDPKELAAAATWLVFGAYLHLAARRDRWSALAPWLIVLGFAGVLFTYIGAGLFLVGEHSYGTS